MKNASITSAIETVKELGRIVLFAGLAALSGYIIEKLKLGDPSSIYYIVFTLVARMIDKFIHENEKIRISGLAPF